MRVVVFDRKYVTFNEIPDTTIGQVNIIRSDENRVQFLANAYVDNGEWVMAPNSGIRFYNIDEQKPVKLIPGTMLNTELLPSKERVIFLVENENSSKNEYFKISIGNKQRIRIGNTPNVDIYYDSGFEDSPIDIELEFVPQKNKIIARNYATTWMYFNRRFFKEAEGQYGDSLYVLGLHVILSKDFVMVNRPNESLNYSLPRWETAYFDSTDKGSESGFDNMVFSVSLRNNIRDFKPENIKIEKPPALREPEKQSAILMIGPALTMSGASVLSSIVSVQTLMASGGSMMNALPTMVMAGSMVLGSLIWPTVSRKYEAIQNKRKNLQIYENYKKYLERVHGRILAESAKETDFLNNLYPTLNECVDKISGRETSLWERSMDDSDFLDIYVGQGDRPLFGEIIYPEISELEVSDACSKELDILKQQEYVLQKVPCSVSLKKHLITGVIGDRKDVLNFFRGMIIELVALHNYDELKIVILFDPEEKGWKKYKWLPHCWTNDKSLKLMGSKGEEVKEISNHLEIAYRERLEMDDEDQSYASPHYIIIAADRNVAERAAIVKELYKNKEDVHMSLVVLYDEKKHLPKRCTSVIEVDGESLDLYNFIDSRLSIKNVKNTISFPKDSENLNIQLANIKLDVLASGGMLPETISFFDMFKIGQPAQFDFMEKWNQADPTKSLAAPIGIDKNGYPIMLDIHEKMHGPHGLIAGMTGSGKSEFIISYIAALAMYYNPQEVAFILIDFKGGGMADVFKNLPHLVGSITNLDGNELNRSLLAIQSELEKRQKLFKTTSEELKISNIDIYKYQSLKREGRVEKPLPHLIIISDEFAELKQQQPEFMDQLIRIARIGRSLGVHLILATQKPDGVVDEQIKSNIKFKICLKVQDRSDSQSVIDCPDAAALVNAGRFYLKVGMNELFELGQSGWSGAPYRPKMFYEKEPDHSIMLVDGARLTTIPGVRDERVYVSTNENIPEKQIDALVEEIRHTAENHLLVMDKLWLDKLPGPELKEGSSLPTEKEPFILNPIVGQYDDLRNQTYEPLSVPFSYSGNAVVYGVSGSGTLEFVNKVMMSSIDRYSEEEVKIYAIDFDAGSLTAFEPAPHVGGIYCSHELEKISHLMTQIEQELDTRKKLFSRYGGNYQTYMNSKPEEPIPNILIVVHNYPSAIDAIDDAEYRLNKLAREGIKFGIFLLITVTDSNSLSFRHVPLYRQVFVLQQNNNDEYYSILGRTEGIFPSAFLGRGIFKRNNTVYEFQTDMILQDAESLYEAISNHCKSLCSSGEEYHEAKVEERVILNHFLGNSVSAGLSRFPYGIDLLSDEKKYFDFTTHTFQLVITDPSEEKENWSWFMKLVKNVVIEEDVVVYDMNPQETGYKTLSSLENIEQDIQSIIKEIYHRSDEAKASLSKGESIPDFDRKVIIIKDFSSFNRDLTLDTKKLFRFMGENVSKNYHITFIFFDQEKIYSETVFRYCTRQYEDGSIDRGLWLGRTLGHQQVFLIDEEVDDMPLSKDKRGYLISDKKAYMCRLIEEM